MSLAYIRSSERGVPPEILSGNVFTIGIFCWMCVQNGYDWENIRYKVIQKFSDLFSKRPALFDKKQLKRYYKDHFYKAIKYWRDRVGISDSELYNIMNKPLLLSSDVPEEVFEELSHSIRTIMNITTAAALLSGEQQ